MPRRFFSFGRMARDGTDYDSPDLDEARNVIPVYGIYRPIRKAMVASGLSVVDGPSGITGGVAHFYTGLQANLERGPVEDIADGEWEAFGKVHPEFPDDFFRQLWEKEPDDSRGILFVIPTPTAASAGPSTYEGLLEELPDPGVDTDHVIAYKYQFGGDPGALSEPTSSMDLTVRLLQGITVIATLGTHTTDTPDNEWNYEAVTLTALQAAAITDYSDLRISFEAEITDSARRRANPDSDLANQNGWIREDGSGSDLWQSINDAQDPNDEDTYVTSNRIASGATSSYRFGLQNAGDPSTNQAFNVLLAAAAMDAGLDMTVLLLENGVQRSGRTFTDISTTPTAHSFILNQFAASSIKDFGALEMQVTFKAHGSPGPGGLSIIPASFDGTPVNTTGNVTALQAVDGQRVVTGAGVDGGRFRVNLQPGVDPGTDTNHAIRLVGHRVGGNAGVSVQLYSGGAQIYDSRDTDGSSGRPLPTAVDSEILFNVPVSAVQQITGYGSLKVQVLTHAGASGGAGHYNFLALEVPGGRRGRLFSAVFAAPAVRIGVSWARMFTPDPDSAETGDVTEIYAGDYESIYRVNDSGWTDVSKAGGYGAAGVPRSWSMVPFGSNLIATNKSDPVQVKEPADALFKDLITSTQKPQAASACMVRRHVILSNIEYTGAGGGDPDGFPDEWWCSALDDPQDFDIALVTGANRGRTQSTAGEIVGSVGGEFALLFKTGSVQRLDYVGSPGTFRESVVSSTDGTVFPRSIVQQGRDVYFLDTDGFKVVRNGQYVDRVGDGAVNRMVTDSAFESRAVQYLDTDTIPEAESTVIGAYDSITNTIWWALRTRGVGGAEPSDVWMNNVIVVYNPAEDRWSVIELTGVTPSSPTELLGLSVTHLIGLPPAEEASDAVTRGMAAIFLVGDFPASYDLSFRRFIGESTYPCAVWTKTWSSKVFSQDMGEIQVNAARAVYRMGAPVSSELFETPENVTRPDVQIAVQATDDPLMEIGVKTQFASLQNGNSDYWYPFRASGEFFRFRILFPELVNQTIREIKGIEIDFKNAGER